MIGVANFVKATLFILLSGAFLVVSASAVNYPAEDLNENYKINLGNPLLFAGQWLDEACRPGFGCADLVGGDSIEQADFALPAAK
jgi:hypothetical protein